MAQIAHARQFNGGTDSIICAHGSLENPFDGLTELWLLKPAEQATLRGIAGHSSGNYTFLIRDTDRVGVFSGTNSTFFWTDGEGHVVVPDVWQIIGCSKPDGDDQVPVSHHWRADTDTWAHESFPTPNDGDDPPALDGGGVVWIGSNGGASPYEGLAAVGARWLSNDLTIPEIEGLTTSFGDWLDLSPTALWLLDQADVATPVQDRAGASHEIDRVGTTAVEVSDLLFDVGGADPWPGAVDHPSSHVRIR